MGLRSFRLWNALIVENKSGQSDKGACLESNLDRYAT